MSSIEDKKKALGILAHRGDLQAYNFLKRYDEKPDAGMLVKMVDHPEDKVVRVLRWLLDHNKITRDNDNRLSWI